MTTISDERLAELVDHYENHPAAQQDNTHGTLGWFVYGQALALRELQRRRTASGPMAPIARVTVDGDGWAANCTMYAPGLPPGEHDLYPEPPQRADIPIVRGDPPSRYEHENGDCAGGP